MYIMTRRQAGLAAVVVDFYPFAALDMQPRAEHTICNDMV